MREEEHLETYGDPRIASLDAPIPGWLKLTYVILPIWGIIVWHLYWNGSSGWLDRGSWKELQEAANTTYPFRNLSDDQNEGNRQNN
ncbi:MAG TPA: hypothetical protein PLC42_07690 [Parachlamydiaceae bacterium]|nr:hypothetical protein [Parachlamydiaceae bacterium]